MMLAVPAPPLSVMYAKRFVASWPAGPSGPLKPLHPVGQLSAVTARFAISGVFTAFFLICFDRTASFAISLEVILSAAQAPVPPRATKRAR